ncbi:MAG: response regulator [Thermoplasmatota archaeon]
MPALSVPNILWAEDMEGDRRLIEQALEEVEHRPAIRFVPDGPRLLETLESEEPPSLVVLDLNMPGMHGTEVLQRLRQRDATKKVPVIVFTSSPNLDEYSLCSRLGADAVVHKPTNLDGFLQAVRRITDKANKVAARRR